MATAEPEPGWPTGSPTRMADLVARLTAAGRRRSAAASWPLQAEFDAVLAILSADYPAPPRIHDLDNPPGADIHPAADPLQDIAADFGLDRLETAVLWAAAAADLEPSVAHAYAALHGSRLSIRPTVGLVLELAGVPTNGPAAFTVLSQGGALRRHGLLTVVGEDPWLLRPLAIPEPVLATLAGAAPDDPLVRAITVPVVPVRLPGVEDIRRAIEGGEHLVWVQSGPGTPGASLAAAGIRATGLDYLCVDAHRARAGEPRVGAMGAAARQAGLLARALLVLGGEAVAESADDGAFRPLADAAVPVVVVSNRAWDPSWLPSFPLILDAQPLTAADRSAVWSENLGPALAANASLSGALEGFRLTPDSVRETLRYARKVASACGRPLDAATVREAARRVGGARGAPAGPPRAAGDRSGPDFADLILPDDGTAAIHRLVAWGRHRNDVAANGPLNRRGITALFAGRPGTGKTLAAHVVAEELALDLLQVDLATVVDKYIGETEKNLEKVFLAAEALDVVLFFDEADSLFGARSEVRDSHDRYANQETAYLLQRMERFDGITILATNLRGNLDPAFSRRLNFIVHFPDPDPATRRRLWEHHLAQLPSMDLQDPVPVDMLAAQVEVSGGDIRNIVRSAEYDAASERELVGMRHIVSATIQEFRKLGRMVPAITEWRTMSRG